MENLKKGLVKCVGDLALIAGGSLVTVGAGMYSVPAGFIVAGVLVIAGVVLNTLGGDKVQ